MLGSCQGAWAGGGSPRHLCFDANTPTCCSLATRSLHRHPTRPPPRAHARSLGCARGRLWRASTRSRRRVCSTASTCCTSTSGRRCSAARRLGLLFLFLGMHFACFEVLLGIRPPPHTLALPHRHPPPTTHADHQHPHGQGSDAGGELPLCRAGAGGGGFVERAFGVGGAAREAFAGVAPGQRMCPTLALNRPPVFCSPPIADGRRDALHRLRRRVSCGCPCVLGGPCTYSSCALLSLLRRGRTSSLSRQADVALTWR